MALVRYEEFAQESGDSPEHQWALARAYGRVGDIRRRLGQWGEADVAFARSVELYEPLVRDNPGVPDYVAGLAQVHHYQAIISVKHGRRDER